MKRIIAKYASAILGVFASVFTVTEKYPLGDKPIPPKARKK